jgi:hypothetical protein
MIYPLATLAGIAGAAIGVVVGMIAVAIFGVPSFEGASGYLIGFLFGPAGGLIGLVLAVVLTLRFVSARHGAHHGAHHGARPSNATLVGRTLLTLGGTAMIGAAAFGLFYLNQPLVNLNGPAPRLEFEIRLPSGAALPALVEVNLDTPKNRMPATLGDSGSDDGRMVVRGIVELNYRTAQRMLVLSTEPGRVAMFALQLGAKPNYSKGFSAWQKVDFIDTPKSDSQPRKPTGTENFEVRYRISDPLAD